MHINLLLKCRSSPLYKNAVVPFKMSLCRKADGDDAVLPINCWSFQVEYKIYHTVNRLQSSLSFGHLVIQSSGHLVIQSSIFNVVTNEWTNNIRTYRFASQTNIIYSSVIVFKTILINCHLQYEISINEGLSLGHQGLPFGHQGFPFNPLITKVFPLVNQVFAS